MSELGDLLPQVASTLVPMTTYVITTAPLGEALTGAVGYRGGISDTEHADNHYRIVGGDRLMLSGRSTAWARDPQALRQGADRRHQEDLSAAR